MKKIILVLMLLVTITITFTACHNSPVSSDDKLNSSQEQLMDEAVRKVGMPAIKNFQQRQTLKDIQELCDQEKLINYCYLSNEMNGSVGQFLGKCCGYPIPFSTQFTSPSKIVEKWVNGTRYRDVMPQADPNGLFMPSNTEATWVILIDPKTDDPHPVYIEPKVIVSPFPLPNYINIK